MSEPKWTPFDERFGSRQDMPPRYKTVLVYVESLSTGSPRAISVGYRKDAAGDTESPYFVVPGHGGRVLAWMDCLPKPLKYVEHRDEFINYWKWAEDALVSTVPPTPQAEKRGPCSTCAMPGIPHQPGCRFAPQAEKPCLESKPHICARPDCCQQAEKPQREGA